MPPKREKDPSLCTRLLTTIVEIQEREPRRGTLETWSQLRRDLEVQFRGCETVK